MEDREKKNFKKIFGMIHKHRQNFQDYDMTYCIYEVTRNIETCINFSEFYSLSSAYNRIVVRLWYKLLLQNQANNCS